MKLFYITDAQYIAICCALLVSVAVNLVIFWRWLARKFPGLIYEEEEPEQEKRPTSKYFINL